MRLAILCILSISCWASLYLFHRFNDLCRLILLSFNSGCSLLIKVQKLSEYTDYYGGNEIAAKVMSDRIMPAVRSACPGSLFN